MKPLQIIIPMYLPMPSEVTCESETDIEIAICIGVFLCGIALGILIECLIENNPFKE